MWKVNVSLISSLLDMLSRFMNENNAYFSVLETVLGGGMWKWICTNGTKVSAGAYRHSG